MDWKAAAGLGEHEYRTFSPGHDSSARIRAALFLGLFAFVFSLVFIDQVVTLRVWKPYLGAQTKKLERLAQLGAKVDVLFIGPSHVEFDVDPWVFDAQLSRCGHKVFSFNAAVGDLRGPELAHYLEALALVPKLRPKVVFIEPLINPTPSPHRLFTTRARYHFSWGAIEEGVKVRLTSDLPWKRKLGSISLQLAAALVHQLNLGVLADVLLPRCPACIEANLEAGPFEERPSRRFDRGNGAEAANPKTIDSAGYSYWLKQPGNARFVDQDGLSAAPRALTVDERAYLAKTFERIRALGAKPIALFPPLSSELLDHRSIHLGIKTNFPEVPTMPYYFDGKRLTDLFGDGPSWFDQTHMSAHGAVRFTERFAADYCEMISAPTTGGANHAVH